MFKKIWRKLFKKKGSEKCGEDIDPVLGGIPLVRPVPPRPKVHRDER